MNKAFLLGAGLGTRLRPLTSVLPKPLIPVLNKPLITYGFDLLLHAGVEQFIVNTHHLPEAWDRAFPTGSYDGHPIRFLRESPEILETGGALANAAGYLKDDHFIVFNADIFTDLPLEQAMIAHRSSGNLVTLILRSLGPEPNVNWDPMTQKVKDLRGILGTECPNPVQFTGIYLVNPEFLDYVKPVKESVIPAFISAIQEENRVGGTVIEEGFWYDLGNREQYLDASATLAAAEDRSPFETVHRPVRIHADARIDPSADIDALSAVGADCEIGAGAVIRSSILWDGARVADGARLERCVVTGREPVAAGVYQDQDL